MRFRYLSYPLKSENPVYGVGNEPLDLRKTRSIASGDSANVCQFTIRSHLGTHVDLPNHFFENGKKVTDYPAEFWIFKAPETVQVALKPSEILKCGEWLDSIAQAADILLLRSGWAGMRGDRKYSIENPGINPEVAFHLRKKYPKLRAIGIDWISVSPYSYRALGRSAHQAFLDPAGDNNPIAIIEDMDLSCDLEGLREVFVVPLRIQESDSAPCTVIGGFLD